jgi:hypothetical protein
MSAISVWCHGCNSNCSANFNNDIQEYECEICGSNFVEETNQGIENFRNYATNNNNTTIGNRSSNFDPSAENTDHREIVQQIIDRLLGINSGESTMTTNDSSSQEQNMIVQQPAPENNRPYGFIIRSDQSEAPLPTFLFNSPGEDNSVPRANVGARGIFGLLSSLTAMRQGPSLSESSQFEQFLHHILMHESSHAGAPPASEELIASLSRTTATATSPFSPSLSPLAGAGSGAGLGECSISQEPFEEGEVVVTLLCGHAFKEQPIVHWLKMHNTCPVCRLEVLAPEPSSAPSPS